VGGVTQRIKVGDYLLCYLIGAGRFIGLLEVIKPAFQSNEPIWKVDVFPSRVSVEALIQLKPETAVPIRELKNLSCFAEGKPKAYWTSFVRSSPFRWKPEDGKIVVAALQDAERNPVVRPVDLKKSPPAVKPKAGPGVVPASRPQAKASAAPEGQEPEEKQPPEHLEIQWMLAKLGNDMGLDV
jgi:hypothetical protein